MATSVCKGSWEMKFFWENTSALHKISGFANEDDGEHRYFHRQLSVSTTGFLLKSGWFPSTYAWVS
jgi:hypothetical protein